MKIKLYRGLFWAGGADDKQAKALDKAKWTQFVAPNGKTFWKTSQKRRVTSFGEFCEGKALKVIRSYIVANLDKISESIAEDSDIALPVPEGLAYLPFQKAGVAYTVRRKDTLIGDSMGLGKTIQAIGVANYDRPKMTVIICPASLKKNWENEWLKWYCFDSTPFIVNGDDWPTADDKADVIILNPDIASRHTEALHKLDIDLLIIDEVHYYTNENSGRTRTIFGYKGGSRQYRSPPLEAKRRVALTGTPIRTKIHDLWVICRAFDPNGIGANYWTFVRRYCGGGGEPGDFIDKSGSSNLELLQERCVPIS
jgi:SWI/SNF-related matrix-associated actin-dependent regulator 1 of chromatin subfamily A